MVKISAKMLQKTTVLRPHQAVSHSIPPFSSTPFLPILTFPTCIGGPSSSTGGTKGDDSTSLTTIMITGPVAVCVLPFDKLGLPLHFVVCLPASVDFRPSFFFQLSLSSVLPHPSLFPSYRPRPTSPCRSCAAALDAMGIQTDLRCWTPWS